MKPRDIMRDLAGLAGAGLVAGGAGMVFLPAGLIVGGLMLLGAAIALARRG